MLKREDINKADKLSTQLYNLEAGLRYFQLATVLDVTGRDGIHRLELGDYPEPSELGRTFLSVRTAMVEYYERGVREKKEELEKLGVRT